jgi:hypothetical protein
VELDKSLKVDSCFYWLNNIKSYKGINNADYILNKSDLDVVEEASLTNGLHKSVSEVNIFRECDDFPINVVHNRYHYLNFTLPQAWHELEHRKATIKTDSSLGMSRKIGFRNSYGLPFYPYNFQDERPFDTLIFPLQVMDVALQSHGNQNRHEVVEEVMGFINKNKTDSVISLLFHNNELTSGSNNYMLEAYKDIVDIINESDLEISGIGTLYNEYK